MRKLISEEYDPQSGITMRYFHDAAAGTITVQRLQDVETNLKQNVQAFNSHSSKGRHNMPGGLGRKVASIPFAVIEKWMREGFNIFTATDDQIRRRLNDSNYSKLRTAPGKL